jgi:uncharacterized membrane protein
MKKTIILLGLGLMAFLVIFPIFISASAEATVSEPTEPFDWSQLLTIPGAIAATLLIVQYCKMPLDKVWKIPTRLLVLIIALGLMTLAKYATAGVTLMDWPLLLVNAFTVALSAMGAYEVFMGKKEAK